MFESVFNSTQNASTVPKIYAHVSLALDTPEVKHIRKVIGKLSKGDFVITVIEVLRCAYGNVDIPCGKARTQKPMALKYLETALNNVCKLVGSRKSAAQEILDRHHSIDVITELAVDLEENQQRENYDSVFIIFRWCVLNLLQIPKCMETETVPHFCVSLCVQAICRTLQGLPDEKKAEGSIGLLAELLEVNGSETYFKTETGVELVGHAMKTLRALEDTSNEAAVLLSALTRRYESVVADHVTLCMKRAFPDFSSIALFSGLRHRMETEDTLADTVEVDDRLAATIIKLWR